MPCHSRCRAGWRAALHSGGRWLLCVGIATFFFTPFLSSVASLPSGGTPRGSRAGDQSSDPASTSDAHPSILQDGGHDKNFTPNKGEQVLHRRNCDQSCRELRSMLHWSLWSAEMFLDTLSSVVQQRSGQNASVLFASTLTQAAEGSSSRIRAHSHFLLPTSLRQQLEQFPAGASVPEGKEILGGPVHDFISSAASLGDKHLAHCLSDDGILHLSTFQHPGRSGPPMSASDSLTQMEQFLSDCVLNSSSRQSVHATFSHYERDEHLSPSMKALDSCILTHASLNSNPKSQGASEVASFVQIEKASKDKLVIKFRSESFRRDLRCIRIVSQAIGSHFILASSARSQNLQKSRTLEHTFQGTQGALLYLEPAPKLQLRNYWEGKLIASGSSSGISRSPSFYAKGLDGSGQVIAVADSGVDFDNCLFWETSGLAPVLNSLNPGRQKIIAYFAHLTGVDSSWSQCSSSCGKGDFSDSNGHGTHVAGTASSKARGGDSSLVSAAARYQAVANGSKLVVQDIMEGGGGLSPPSDLNAGLFPDAYAAGARIHVDSWGCSPPVGDVAACNVYDTMTREVDQFAVDHPDFLIIFAAGNDGMQAQGSIGSVGAPATCKNCLSVGASEIWPDAIIEAHGLDSTAQLNAQFSSASGYSGGRSPENVAEFSSPGPCSDGRRKPDVIAPGVAVLSAQTSFSSSSGSAANFECGSSSDPPVQAKTGTSMAAPSIASLAAVFRQYFASSRVTLETGLSPITSPSSALLRAAILLSATPVTGVRFKLSSSGWVPTLGAQCPPTLRDGGSNSVKYAISSSPDGRLQALGAGIGHCSQSFVSSALGDDAQGFGRPIADKLFPSAPQKLFFVDRGSSDGQGLVQGQAARWSFKSVDLSKPLVVSLAWTDAPGSPLQVRQLVNDLDLIVHTTEGDFRGNGGVTADFVNNAEKVFLQTESTVLQDVTVTVLGWRVTASTSNGQGFSLVATGVWSHVDDLGLVSVNVPSSESSADSVDLQLDVNWEELQSGSSKYGSPQQLQENIKASVSLIARAVPSLVSVSVPTRSAQGNVLSRVSFSVPSTQSQISARHRGQYLSKLDGRVKLVRPAMQAAEANEPSISEFMPTLLAFMNEPTSSFYLLPGTEFVTKPSQDKSEDAKSGGLSAIQVIVIIVSIIGGLGACVALSFAYSHLRAGNVMLFESPNKASQQPEFGGGVRHGGIDEKADNSEIHPRQKFHNADSLRVPESPIGAVVSPSNGNSSSSSFWLSPSRRAKQMQTLPFSAEQTASSSNAVRAQSDSNSELQTQFKVVSSASSPGMVVSTSAGGPTSRARRQWARQQSTMSNNGVQSLSPARATHTGHSAMSRSFMPRAPPESVQQPISSHGGSPSAGVQISQSPVLDPDALTAKYLARAIHMERPSARPAGTGSPDVSRRVERSLSERAPARSILSSLQSQDPDLYSNHRSPLASRQQSSSTFAASNSTVAAVVSERVSFGPTHANSRAAGPSSLQTQTSGTKIAAWGQG